LRIQFVLPTNDTIDAILCLVLQLCLHISLHNK